MTTFTEGRGWLARFRRGGSRREKEAMVLRIEVAQVRESPAGAYVKLVVTPEGFEGNTATMYEGDVITVTVGVR